ncbi:cytochrome P450, partial [Planctomycetota bacterium]|nr:cytochrome P450 [Planctomycetota bacterium]
MFLGCLPQLKADPLALYDQGFREFGDVVRYPLLGGLFQVVAVASAAGVEQVLSRNHANYRKPEVFLSAVRDVFGDGVFTSGGAAWKRKRRLMAPTFRKDRLIDLVPGIVSAAETHLDRWQRNATDEPQDVLDPLSQLTLDVAARVFFGVELGADTERFSDALREAFEQLGHRLASAFH